MRYDLPPDLTPEEEKTLIAALERYFTDTEDRPDAWSLSARLDNMRLGILQVRHQVPNPWQRVARLPYAHRGTPNLHGRGDAR